MDIFIQKQPPKNIPFTKFQTFFKEKLLYNNNFTVRLFTSLLLRTYEHNVHFFYCVGAHNNLFGSSSTIQELLSNDWSLHARSWNFAKNV